MKARMAVPLALTLHAQPPHGRKLDAEGVAESGGDFLEFENLLNVRLFVDSVKRWDALPLQIARHSFIGGEHEFLNKAVRDISFGSGDSDHAAVLVKLDFRLRQIEVNGAALVATAVQDLRQLFHQLEMLDERLVTLARRRITRQNIPHGGIGHALGATNDA